MPRHEAGGHRGRRNRRVAPDTGPQTGPAPLSARGARVMAGPAGPPPTVVVPGGGWVDVASRAVVQVGFPVVVAAVLLWFLLTKFQANMDAITTRMGNNTTVVATLIDQERGSFEELKKQSVELHEQTVLMQQAVKDVSTLVEIRRDELEVLRNLARGAKP